MKVSLQNLLCLTHMSSEMQIHTNFCFVFLFIGKDPISSKLEHLKATSKLAKERNSEKTARNLEILANNNANNEQKILSDPVNGSLKLQSQKNTSDSNTEVVKKGEGLCSQIKPDNQIRQSKIVANLTEKTSNVSPSASRSNILNETDSVVSNQCITANSSMESNCNGQVVSSPNSSIPKPTLAVKGTSKVIKEEKKPPTAGSEGGLTVISAPKSLKISNQDPQAGTKLSREDIYVAVHIAGPDTQVLDTGQQLDKRNTSYNKSDRSRSENRSGTVQCGVSIAMVSPIMSSNHKDSRNSPQNMQNSEKILHSSLYNNDSKPPKSKSTSNFKTEHIYETCDKISPRNVGSVLSAENATIWEEGEDMLVNIKPMQPIVRASPYGYMRGLGPLSSPRVIPNRLQSGLRIHSDYGETGRMNSGRQFLTSLDSARMYGAGMKRVLSGCNSLIDAEYAADIEPYDLAAGYLSDGEILRPGISYRSDDISSGYLSEGGAPSYSRKMASRARESEREQKMINVLQDDRYVTQLQVFTILFFIYFENYLFRDYIFSRFHSRDCGNFSVIDYLITNNVYQ